MSNNQKLLPDLIEDFHVVWHRLWSVRLSICSALFGIASLLFQVVDSIFPYLGVFLPPKAFAIASILLAIGSAFARLIKQKSLDQLRKIG